MRVLLIGAGVVGTVYGAQLAAGGHSVSVLAHGERTEEVAVRGLVVRDAITGVELASPVVVVPDASTASYDVVVVAVRYEQLPSAGDALAVLTGHPTVFYLGNNPGGHVCIRGCSPGDVIRGFPGIGGALAAGVVNYAKISQQPTALDDSRSPVLLEVEQALQGQGFATQRVTDMEGWLTHHAVFVASVTAALYLCDVDPERLAHERQTLSLMCRAITEGFAGLRREKVGGAPASLAFLHRAALRPIAVSYWARMLASPMGELCFAGHARTARGEMHAIGLEALTWVGDRDRAPHLWQLLDT